ncbi:hypothetical protein QAD02_000355 [Eretmocerus hayati]|uniref:Uncharacterized protein n=1 Tax=Eretmocerus hayati TaxID=131215 RepID=A0ACC2NDD4_9HYME|nr:hypothetical protein QAD02_000355 [Eretmocerus hayati]
MKPSITYISQTKIVNIGDTVELICSVVADRGDTILWEKANGNIFISLKTTKIIPTDRFSTKFDPKSSSYKLEIKGIQESDEGIYRCQIISDTIVEKAEVELFVRRQPIIHDNSTLSEVATEGQNVTMVCYASGYPTPEIWWSRLDNSTLPSKQIVHKGNTLEFSPVYKKDDGTYHCSASNRVGKSVRRRVSLQVLPVPIDHAHEGLPDLDV